MHIFIVDSVRNACYCLIKMNDKPRGHTMNATTLTKKIEKAGYELSKISGNEVMEMFKFVANGKTYTFCTGNGEAYGFRRDFENGENPSYYDTANEMLRMAARI